MNAPAAPSPAAIPPSDETPAPPVAAWHRRTFASFASANYRWFFFGQGTSVVGLWMRDAAQGWLVYDLTGSYAALGVVTGISRGALGLLTAVGGAAADRFDKRRLLLFLCALSSLLSLGLGALVLGGRIEVWQVCVVAGLSGAVKGFEIPTRQAFVVEMVGRDLLPNAIALNTAMFNSARVLGPLAAGLLMHSSGIGIALCFLADGVTYLAVIYSLTRIRPLPTGAGIPGGGWREQVREGFACAWGNRRVRTLMALLLVFVTFGWSYLTILPAFVRDVLRLDARWFGLLMGLNGLGSLLGALYVASAPVPASRAALRRTVFGAVALSAAAVAAFGVSPGPWTAGAALVVAGFGGVGFLSRGNLLVQVAVPDRLRGRVMGLWVLVFIGGMALGGLLLGAAAERFGAPAAVAASGAACILLSAGVWAALPRAAD